MKRKAKAIHAELRKESKSFDGWLKYEVTIVYPNGKTEQVPAYGKDLQDALSRVAHDKKVEKLTRINLPTISAVLLIILALITFTIIGYNLDRLGDSTGPVVISAVVVLATLTLSVGNWFSIRNTDK